MRRLAWALALVLLLCGAVWAGAQWYLASYDAREPSRVAFQENCAACHGEALEGTQQGPSLEGSLAHGAELPQLMTSIRTRHPGWTPGDLGVDDADSMVKALSLYIIEQRADMRSIVGSHEREIPDGVVASRLHDFRVELVSELSRGPYAIEPLPDGRVLVSEKVRGLSVVSPSGEQGPLVPGTPRVWPEILQVRGSYVGLGMMLDVELHPDYAQNGWIYLSHADRCQLDCGSLWPVSMVRVIRGRIEDGAWVDTQVIWSVHHDHYTVVPDGVAAGRLAFDDAGHLYVTVGGKASYENLHVLDTPYGKVHRVRDDGSVPEDNPFWQPEAERDGITTRHTVYTYGHRTTQGLSSHPNTGEVWSTEMGPRGGDEVNHLRAGGNYGWPLYTEGLDYDATPVTIGADLGLEFARSETIAPVVDFTPAPSLSNFTFHSGDAFPQWQDDLLIGSLRARSLFRVRLRDGQSPEIERLLGSLGRIRDVEMGYDGLVYVLLEHGSSGSLVRLVPYEP